MICLAVRVIECGAEIETDRDGIGGEERMKSILYNVDPKSNFQRTEWNGTGTQKRPLA